MFHHILPQNDTLGFLGEKNLSEQHWQMRHIRLYGCSGRISIGQVVQFVINKEMAIFFFFFFFVIKASLCLPSQLFCRFHFKIDSFRRASQFYPLKHPLTNKNC